MTEMEPGARRRSRERAAARWRGKPKARQPMHLPTQLRQVVTAAGASIHPSCKTLEEVVLMRKCETANSPGPGSRRTRQILPPMEAEFAERIADHPRWEATSLKVLRGRRELPRSVPVVGGYGDGEDRARREESAAPARISRSLSACTVATANTARAPNSASLDDLRDQLHNVLARINDLEAQQMSRARAQTHVRAISNQSQEPRVPGSPHRGEAGPWSGAAAAALPATAESGSEEKEEMIMVMDGIQDTIHRLERALSTTEHEAILRQEQIQAAATRLAAAARGHLQRQRFTRALQALRRWRSRQGAALVRDEVNELMRRRKKIVNRLHEIEVRRREQTKEAVLNAWHVQVVSTRSERAKIIDAAASLRHSLELNLLRMCMHSWLALAVGDRSRKAVEAAYKERYATAVARMEAADATRAIKHTEVVKFLSEEASEHIIKRRAFHTKRICFKAWAEDFLFDLTQLKKRADRFFLLTRFPRFFGAWQEFVRLRQSEAKVAYVWDPARFDADHNERVIKNFSRRRLLRKYGRAWRMVARQNREIRERQRAVLKREVAAVFAAWRTRARFQLEVKRICVDEWRDLGYRRRQLPFRAWYVYTKRARKVREAQAVLLSAFKRRKKRLLQARFFRVWKHKAIYGKIGGLHTRGDLFKALDTQKKMLLAMEVNSDQQKEAISELEGALQAEKNRAEGLQLCLAERKEELIQSKFAQQQLEEEVVRLQALFDAMSLIHPGTAKRLLEMRASEEDGHGVSAVARRAGEKAKMMGAGGTNPSSNPTAAGQNNAGFLGTTSAGGSSSFGAPRGGPCKKCGFDPLQMCAEPLSARARVESRQRQIPGEISIPDPEEQDADGATPNDPATPSGGEDDAQVDGDPKSKGLSNHGMIDDDDDYEAPPSPLPRPTLEAAAVTWVTSQDAEIILRTQWAQTKLKQLANKRHQAAEQGGPDAGEIEIEVRNLQSILGFVLSGNLHDIDLFQPDEDVLRSAQRQQSANLASTTSEMVGNLRKARIHTLSNWNDFLQGLSKQFPLLHSANDNPRLAVQRRIVAGKTKTQKAQLSIQPKGVNLYAAASQ